MRKKSIRLACDAFIADVGEINSFLNEVSSLSDQSVSWAYEYAIIRLYRSFEDFVLSCLICGINNDTAQLSAVTSINFPAHLTDEICEYIIVGGRYFDFKGRDGLIKTIKKYLTDNHYFLSTIRHDRYREVLEKLSTLRNFAAHNSPVSKREALKAVGLDRMASAGSWLKKQNRFSRIATRLVELAQEVRTNALY